MDEEVNGGKRPFGPHGEGCECDWDEEEEGAEEEEGTVSEPVSDLTPEEGHYQRVVELSLDSMSSTLVEHFLDGLDSATHGGSPLSRRQVIAMMSSLMTGYAEARETANQIEYGLRLIARQARAAEDEARAEEERQAEAENKDSKLPGLHDITELFTPPSQRSSDD